MSYSVLFERSQWPGIEWGRALPPLLTVALLVTLMTQLLQIYAQRLTSATTAGMIMMTEDVYKRQVMHMFLQILDDGRLTDSQGRTVSFKDTIIIMTSNAGTGDMVASVGFGAEAAGQTKSVISKLTNYFKPEFLNRFDDIVEFNALTKDDLMKIVGLMIDDVNNMLADRKLHIEVPDAVKERLVDLGFDPKMGARPLRRVIQEHIEDQIADYVLDHPDATNLVAQVCLLYTSFRDILFPPRLRSIKVVPLISQVVLGVALGGR